MMLSSRTLPARSAQRERRLKSSVAVGGWNAGVVAACAVSSLAIGLTQAAVKQTTAIAAMRDLLFIAAAFYPEVEEPTTKRKGWTRCVPTGYRHTSGPPSGSFVYDGVEYES